MPLFGRPNRNPPPVTKPEEPAAPAAPALTKDDIAAAVAAGSAGLKAELEAKIAELRGAISVTPQAPVAPAAPAAPARPVITDDEIEAAIANGTGGAARIRALIDSQVSSLESNVQRRLDEITSRGMTSIASVTREVVLNKLPNYKKYQKEIDAKVAALPPAAQADAEVLKIVHDSVVGAHVADIEREAHEAALRKAAEGDGDTSAPRKTASSPGQGGRGEPRAVPTMEQFAGEGASDILKEKDRRSGVRDQDTFAQSLGYENWAHYMQVEEETRAEAEKLGITLR